MQPLLERADGHRTGWAVLLVFIALAVGIITVSCLAFIERWPTPSRTAETLLVRKDGNEVVFLNDLRFQTNTALNLRAPLNRVAMPAVQAALGRKGVMEGVDYRGVPVVAALQAIPDSPWALVARMDAVEVYAPARRRLWQMLLLVSVLLCGAGAAVWLGWERQRVRFHRERAEAGEAVRASELRYRRLFESAKDGILILDAETGMVVDVNPFLIELLGLSREAFLGKEIWELGLFKDIVANQESFTELQQQEYIRYEDKPLKTADGRRVDVEFVSNVYLVNHQKVIQCNIRDITERKRTADALRTITTHQDVILTTVPSIIMEVDTHKIYTWANRAGFDFFGDDVIGKDATSFFEGEQEISRVVQQLFDGDEQVVYLESWQRRKDGGKRLLSWWCHVLKDVNGHVTGALSTAHDITERNWTEEKLMRNYETQTGLNALLSLSMENRPVPEFLASALALITSLKWLEVESKGCIFLADEAGKNLHLQAQRGMSGALLTMCSTLPFGRCLCGRAAVERTIQFAGCVDERHEVRYEGMLRHGHYCVPILSGDRVLGVLNLYVKEGHTRDSSEEEFLKAVANTLAGFIERKQAEAQREQMQAQLLQSQKLESIGTLAGGVAHEINNPIMGIMNYAQLILDELGPDSPVKEYATEIGKETQRVAAIVRNLLSFARQDSETHKSPAGLCDIVEDTLSLIRAVMRHDQITLEVNVPADLPRILCSSQQIRQVLMNLLTNARDALNEKYPGHDANKKVIISAREVVLGEQSSVISDTEHRTPNTRRWLRLTVEDHGPGIPNELRERIFNPFFSTKTRGKGTGLGLSISHSIVRGHGGTLSVESDVGQWTRFNIDLPVSPFDLAAPEAM